MSIESENVIIVSDGAIHPYSAKGRRLALVVGVNISLICVVQKILTVRAHITHLICPALFFINSN